MRTSFSRVAIITALSLTFAASTVAVASAKGPGGGGGAPHGFSQGHKTGWHGAHVPPGWSKGKKVGWGHFPHITTWLALTGTGLFRRPVA
jgi:hypothetical protein